MRSRRFTWLLAKEWRELTASRAWWLLLLMIGPLVGHAFITAVNSYAEASGIGGGPAALAQGLSPLDGVLVPAFGAYDLALTLLFPFVAIRLISAEKESGGWKLMLQSPPSLGALLIAKGWILLAGWLVAWTPGLVALGLWKAYGGHVYAPEAMSVFSGHLLRLILSAGVAVAAAGIATSAASAAIVTLGFTVGTWALDFVAMGRGGWLQRVAAYTPAAILRGFEQGQLRLGAVLVSLTLGIAGFMVAAVWLRPGRDWASRLIASAALAILVGAVLWAASLPRAAWDLSENRRNSFPKPVEAALRHIAEPLRVRVFLAAEDPRLTDLDRNILGKLERTLPRVEVEYAAHGRTGLFENPADHYGEVWYQLGGRTAVSRSTTEAIVLDTIYRLAGVQAPAQSDEPDYPGYPLQAHPGGAAWVFYGLWPLAVGLAWWLHFRYRS